MAEHHNEEHNHHITPVSTLRWFCRFNGPLALTLYEATPILAPDKTVTMVVAIVKASLIILFFMHLRHSSRVVWIFGTRVSVPNRYAALIALGDYAARGTIQGPI
ncbi:MAG: cytochrome C oxidase subunit IV family protein [Anaerolineales bacterium]|nr:cytochrome C oxidase subunit IV family protein [Anaerolineales bacterium]